MNVCYQYMLHTDEVTRACQPYGGNTTLIDLHTDIVEFYRIRLECPSVCDRALFAVECWASWLRRRALHHRMPHRFKAASMETTWVYAKGHLRSSTPGP